MSKIATEVWLSVSRCPVDIALTLNSESEGEEVGEARDSAESRHGPIAAAMISSFLPLPRCIVPVKDIPT